VQDSLIQNLDHNEYAILMEHVLEGEILIW
jgi:hypothetical protein